MLRKIININCLMTFLVVGIHASCRILLTGEYDSWVSMLNRYVNVLCDMAVPTFFSISAYLFFLKFQIGDYFKKLRSCIKSLIIPYFIFSALGLLLINAKLFVKGEQLRVNNISDILNSMVYSISDMLITKWGAKRSFPKIYCILNGGR